MAQQKESTATKESKTPTQWCWWNFGLPFRPGKGTYDKFDFKTLPLVDTKEFSDIQTIDQLVQHMNRVHSFSSVTGCEWVVDDRTERGPFIEMYNDSQGCLMWCYDPATRGVVVLRPGDRQGVSPDYVATSLPEFLARVKMENAIWRKALQGPTREPTDRDLDGKMFSVSDALFGAPDAVGDLDELWSVLAKSGRLDATELAYLEPYWKLFKARVK